MKGLIIKPKWADLILNGDKTIEIRASKTNIRGEIGIIKSGTKKVFGTVNLFHCVEIDERLFLKWANKHKVDCKFKDLPYKKPYAWCFTNIIKYKEPVAYEHKQGCVIWVNI